ncbi:MAG: C1 family peptidase [Clostridia bacterium]|nr:C1 family peptidase [Clostridia bacterium]
MRIIRKFTAVILVFSVLASFAVHGSAVYEVWNSNIENLENVSSNVKNQNNKGNCVFCATASAAESFVKLYWYEDTAFDEGQAADPGDGTDEGSLANVLGYDNNFENLQNNLTDKPLKTTAEGEYAIDDVRAETEPTAEIIKNMVYSYGSAVVYFNVPENLSFENQQFYHIDNYAYYCPPDKASPNAQHAVCIVGWDDTYSNSMFTISNKPENSGAWICKNSYGTDFGENGYCFISYDQVFFGALSVSVSKDGISKDVAVMPEEGEFCDKLYVMLSDDGSMSAYSYEADGTVHKCKTEKDYTSNYYVIHPDEGTYFSNATACYLNSDELPYGQNDDVGNNPYYKCEQDGKIILQTGGKGGFAVTKVETSKFDLGYIKLTYDNNSTRFILKSSFENNGITFIDYKENPDEFDESKYENLPEAGKGQHYAEIKFSRQFAFKEDFECDGEKFAKRGEADENGDILMVIAVVVTESNPLISGLELIGAIFGTIIPLIFSIFKA